MFLSRPVYPQFGAGERSLAEAPLGSEIAVLTDRRLIVAGAAAEQSVPLAHIALLRVRYERLPKAIAAGIVLVLVAALAFAIAGPVRAFFLNQTVALESSARQEQAQTQTEGNNLAQSMQKLMGGFAALAGGIPILGWLLLAIAAVKLAIGVVGRTVVTVFAGGGELEFARIGRARALEAFVKEVGRQLPGAGERP